MKPVVYANVNADWKERVHTPCGIAQFRSSISRNFITSDLPYTHPNAKAVKGDIITWAFQENEEWFLLGDGYVRNKFNAGDHWEFWIESARLYPRSVALCELSFGTAKKKSLNVGFALTWKEYMELLKKAGTPLV